MSGFEKCSGEMDLPHLHLVRCNQPAFRRLLRAGETFDFTMLHLHPNSSLSVSRLTNNKLLPTTEAGVSETHSHERKGEDDISNRTELTGYFFPLILWSVRSKRYTSFRRAGDVCFMRDWIRFEGKNHYRHLTHHSDPGKMTHERQSKGQEVLNSCHLFRIQPFVDQTPKADRIFFLTRTPKRK